MTGGEASTGVPAIRVVVVDDHALFRQGVIAGLAAANGPARVEVVGEADDVGTGVESIRRHQPDVVLLDVHLTSGSGARIIEALGDELASVRFLALSVSDAPEDVLGLVRAGARGYVTKRIDGEELVEAIASVAQGHAVFSPRLAGFVLDAFTGPVAPALDEPAAPTADGADAPADAELDRLSPREREVMQYLARGYAYKEIAAELHISVRTVESHASAVLRKLQLSSRHELTHWAARHRLV
ncbi:MAG: response regulator transcription factor [Acidimicrobiales bacterium]